MSESALVLGATGLVGSHLLDHLLESDQYDRVSVISRRSTGKKHPKLVEHIFNLEDMETHAHLFKSDALFLCLGTTIKKAGSKGAFKKIDHDFPLTAAKIAYTAGATRCYLVSSIGADTESKFFYLQVKGETEDSISKIGYDSTLIFRPAGLLGKRNEFRPGEKVGNSIMKLISPVMIGPLRKSRPIEANHIAYVLAHLPAEKINGVKIYESDEIQNLYNSFSS